MNPRLVLYALSLPLLLTAQNARLQSSDLRKLKSVRDAQISPDGQRIAYSVSDASGDRNPRSHLEIMTLADKRSTPIPGARSSQPAWSPDSKWLAYSGAVNGKSGLVVATATGANPKLLHELTGTNAPLPSAGRPFAWSPDSRQIVFVHATPGPETAEASGDPVVITRYLYKPELSEGNTRFNDNRRLHLYIADVASGAVRQLTRGDLYEHSPDWSPDGKEILFISNREPDGDQFFNYDIFAVRVSDGVIRRITATESAEYHPAWSPDGKKIAFLATRRGLTDLETTMEDTHVWVMNADGSGRTELGKKVDNRQGMPEWTPDSANLLFTVQQRGSVAVYRVPASGGEPSVLYNEPGQAGHVSTAAGKIAFTFATPSDQAELFLMEGGSTRQLTHLNDALLNNAAIAKVEPLTFVSNDFKYEVEAFLTHPVGRTETSKHPMIVMLHGGPHGQQGPAFNFKAQVYAARGWAVLMVNYRGSTGYGQAFADAVFGDQNGNEAQDVLYAVSAAVRRNPWIDRDRLGVEGGSYGGQLSAWLVTQTHIFKAAIPLAPIINLVSYNYMTYYNMYEQMTFGILPHQGDLMDTLWKRSSLRYVAQVKTPVMLLHGENDNDVCIAESEQFYIGLKDAGVEAVMVRYPREGHGLRETKHIIDSIDRSIQWYEKHFPKK